MNMEKETIAYINSNPKLKNYLSKHQFGRMSPVNHELLQDISDYSIFIDEQIMPRIMELANRTHNNDCEYTFLLGGDTTNNNIELKIFLEHNTDIKNRRAIYDEVTRSRIGSLLEQNLSVFIGHTHPDSGKYYDNFSLGDIDGMCSDYKNNAHFKGKDVAYAMLTGDRHLKVGFYDSNYNSFYKISRIYIRTKDNQIIDFDTYVRDHYNNISEKKGIFEKYILSLKGKFNNLVLIENLERANFITSREDRDLFLDVAMELYRDGKIKIYKDPNGMYMFEIGNIKSKVESSRVR